MITDDEIDLGLHYELRAGTATGLPWDVFVSRTGTEPVLLLHELPGLTPAVASLGDALRHAGFKVHMPSLFGQPGRVPGAIRNAVTSLFACIRSDIQAFHRQDATRPAVRQLRRLVDMASAEAGQRPVGVIGLCLTGGFALALATHGRVAAAVASEPSLPLLRADGIDLDPADQETLRARTASGPLSAILLRFQGDSIARCPRVRRYADVLQGNLEVRCLPDDAADPAYRGSVRHHCVLTNELVDAPGEITLAARTEVIAHLAWRLRGAPRPVRDARIPDCVQGGCVARQGGPEGT